MQQTLDVTEMRKAATAQQQQQQAALTAQAYTQSISSAAGLSGLYATGSSGLTDVDPTMKIEGKIQLGDHEFDANQLGQLFKMLLRDYPELNI